MIFTYEHITMIKEEHKTRTTRKLQQHQYINGSGELIQSHPYYTEDGCETWESRLAYPGQLRSIQPGRGKPAVGYIRICSVEYIDNIAKINGLFAIEEGYLSASHYLHAAWMKLHDKTAYNAWTQADLVYFTEDDEQDFLKNESFWMSLLERPAHYYGPCVSYTFEYVGEKKPWR